MTTVQVNVPDELDLEALAKDAGFADAAAYLESLVRADRKRRAEEWLATEIRRGLDSGPSREITDEEIERKVADHDRRMLAANIGRHCE